MTNACAEGTGFQELAVVSVKHAAQIDLTSENFAASHITPMTTQKRMQTLRWAFRESQLQQLSTWMVASGQDELGLKPAELPAPGKAGTTVDGGSTTLRTTPYNNYGAHSSRARSSAIRRLKNLIQ